jgi:hypothetical protein
VAGFAGTGVGCATGAGTTAGLGESGVFGPAVGAWCRGEPAPAPAPAEGGGALARAAGALALACELATTATLDAADAGADAVLAPVVLGTSVAMRGAEVDADVEAPLAGCRPL